MLEYFGISVAEPFGCRRFYLDEKNEQENGCGGKKWDEMEVALVRSERTSEAREWLSTNPNKYPLAGNRFDSKAEALAFVESLYEAGAMEVRVGGILSEEWRIREEGGPYADTLIVMLPADRKQRAALFEIAAREAEREGLKPDWDRGQSDLILWWD